MLLLDPNEIHGITTTPRPNSRHATRYMVEVDTGGGRHAWKRVYQLPNPGIFYLLRGRERQHLSPAAAALIERNGEPG